MLELMKNISEIEGINCGTGYIGSELRTELEAAIVFLSQEPIDNNDAAVSLERNRILSIIKDVVDEHTYDLIDRLVSP